MDPQTQQPQDQAQYQTNQPVIPFSPKGAEIMPTESAVESIAPSELLKPEVKEQEPRVERQIPQQPAPSATIAPAQEAQPKESVPPQIVDKSQEITKLHKTDNPLNELQKRADKEENEFIEEVEKLHGHK